MIPTTHSLKVAPLKMAPSAVIKHNSRDQEGDEELLITQVQLIGQPVVPSSRWLPPTPSLQETDKHN